MLINWILREADPGDADPQGGSSNGKVRASDLRQQLGSQVDEQALMRLLEKQAELLADNSQLREQRRTLRQERDELKTKLPAEGARILTADEAPLWDAYKALGLPAALKTAIDANGEATAKLAKLERAEKLRAAAEASGFKASVLTTLAGDLDIQVEPVKDGKPLVYVVKDGEKTALADYATANWADFLPALAQGATLAPDINAGARGNGQNSNTITDDERKAAQRRYSATF